MVKRTPVNVCGEICEKILISRILNSHLSSIDPSGSNSCNNNAGTLPPVIDDCAQIKDAIIIFEGQTSPTFDVAAYGIETLTFGTCSFFFQNNDYEELEYCWSDLVRYIFNGHLLNTFDAYCFMQSSQASAAGSACFPPEQPFTSEGLCTASDGTWAVGLVLFHDLDVISF